jgi:hypothetical protein
MTIDRANAKATIRPSEPVKLISTSQVLKWSSYAWRTPSTTPIWSCSERAAPPRVFLESHRMEQLLVAVRLLGCADDSDQESRTNQRLKSSDAQGDNHEWNIAFRQQ